MKTDIFSHILPKVFLEAAIRPVTKQKIFGEREEAIQAERPLISR